MKRLAYPTHHIYEKNFIKAKKNDNVQDIIGSKSQSSICMLQYIFGNY